MTSSKDKETNMLKDPFFISVISILVLIVISVMAIVYYNNSPSSVTTTTHSQISNPEDLKVVTPENEQNSTPSSGDCAEDTWLCENWGECNRNNDQVRICHKTFDCPFIETPSPFTSRYCKFDTSKFEEAENASEALITKSFKEMVVKVKNAPGSLITKSYDSGIANVTLTYRIVKELTTQGWREIFVFEAFNINYIDDFGQRLPENEYIKGKTSLRDINLDGIPDDVWVNGLPDLKFVPLDNRPDIDLLLLIWRGGILYFADNIL